MSTSSDTPKGDKPLRQPSAASQPKRADAKPGLTLLRGIAWIAATSAVIITLVMNYDVIWNMLADGVPLVLEVAEESLDTFFEKIVGLNPGFAQMATAYTGFVLVLVALYLLVRKIMSLYKKAETKADALKMTYANAWKLWYEEQKTNLLHWWNTLDLLNKIIATIAFILIGIPLALLVSVVLGSLVASMI
ncbi:MAG: hypothetical protein PHE55_16415 [Methylococcaceae bacterium]|nr:hypothetical protein [Methylococcaceae bacterium]